MRRKGLRNWTFPLIGIASFIWFLARVLPKPSRAAYPCQRVAAPLAASFVMWLSGLLTTAFTCHRWRVVLAERRRLALILCTLSVVAAGLVTAISVPCPSPAYPDLHDPIGSARGLHPGRVVWVHNPGATDWAGFTSPDHWFDDAHTDPDVVERMVSQAVRGVAGKNTDEEAWDAIFRYYNRTHGRGDRGYVAGEKIMIKLNMVNCNVGGYHVSKQTWEKKPEYMNGIDVAPQMVRALLKQLVVNVGVTQSNVTVGDSTALWPNCYLTQIRAQYPDAYYQQNLAGPNRTQAILSDVPVNWSTADANGKLQDRAPTSYATADYLINFTTLKGHGAGVTLCAKNHYGSLIRLPNGVFDGVKLNYYIMHWSLPNSDWAPGTGRYRALVDLMGNPEIGGKTVLYLIDGLYGGFYSNAYPLKWLSEPFNNDWPSSLFASQDPVAIDSVGYDFLKMEWPDVVSGGDKTPGSLLGGAEDYLHEAALADDPPSGTLYDPDRDGVPMQSLGVHEHWNNPIQRLYDRNRGGHAGIELLTLRYDSGSIQNAKQRASGTTQFLICGATITTVYTNNFYVESDSRECGILVKKTAHALQPGTRVNLKGAIATNSNDERYINEPNVVYAGTGSIRPLLMHVKDLGGSDWKRIPGSDAGQRGIPGTCGANNIGLLVKVCGEITETNTVASPRASGTVKVYLNSTGVMPAYGTKVSVVGVSSCEYVNSILAPVLRLQ